ncbi:MAG TPA: methyltransferase [Candidatus Acidoferrum sp.]|nr:methyltransferase [Candidatus Acidoferrum sp.]
MKKAPELQTIRGVKIYPPDHKRVQKLLTGDSEPEIHGDKVWFSSYFIMDHLEANPPEPKTRILDIGCGWGALAIYCVKQFRAKVTGVDADKYVFPLLDLHAKLNNVNVGKKVSKYEDLKPDFLAKQDIILGGDICFWDELVEPLHTLIKNALDAGVKKIVIADPGRPPFLRLARRCRKLYKGKLKSVKITAPRRNDGYLLIIEKGK